MSEPEFEAPDFFDIDDWTEENGGEPDDSKKKYKNTTLGRWLLHRMEAGEIIVPVITDAVPQGDVHHPVGWWQRIRKPSGLEPGLNQYQLVCGCVMDMAPAEVDQGHFECDAIDKFVSLGAEQARKRTGIDEITAFFNTPVDESTQGKVALEAQLVEGLLINTAQNPDLFSGNRIGGTHWVTGLARVLHKSKAETRSITQNLQNMAIVEIAPDETVYLRSA